METLEIMTTGAWPGDKEIMFSEQRGFETKSVFFYEKEVLRLETKEA